MYDESNIQEAGYWLASADDERELHLVRTIALATTPAVWRSDGDYLSIARVPQAEGAATQSFVFPAGEQSAQIVKMPADDAVVVHW